MREKEQDVVRYAETRGWSGSYCMSIGWLCSNKLGEVYVILYRAYSKKYSFVLSHVKYALFFSILDIWFEVKMGDSAWGTIFFSRAVVI